MESGVGVVGPKGTGDEAGEGSDGSEEPLAHALRPELAKVVICGSFGFEVLSALPPGPLFCSFEFL